jgi:hypothetical protein
MRVNRVYIAELSTPWQTFSRSELPVKGLQSKPLAGAAP